MTSTFALPRRAVALAAAAALVAASLIPALAGLNKVNAATVTERKITLSTSKTSTSATYDVSFKVASTTSILGIVVDMCQNSPLIGDSCTKTNGVTGSPVSGTISVSKNGGAGVAFNVDVDLAGSDSTSDGKLLLTHGTGITALAVGDTITLSFTATNPSATGTFYGRILTYATEAGIDSYTAATPGTHIDDGGVALSTANQLTVSARVQEQLQFCVGTTTVDDATTSLSADCAAAFTGSAGNSVDMGVLDNSAVYVSGPTNAATGDNGVNGAAMVRTNANNGVIISFYPEAGTGTNHTRALRVSGATCDAAIPSTSNTDQCFNSADTTQAAFTAGTERFGMTIAGTNCGSTTAYTCAFASSSNKLVAGANWNGSGAGTFGTAEGFAWHENATATTIASSTSVVDDEALILKFGGTANITTPTGQYGVTSTYIATATF